MICYEVLEPDQQFSLSCEHTFCKLCWLEDLTVKIKEGIDGLSSKCMQQHCNLKVGHSDFLRILEKEDKERYWKLLTKSLTKNQGGRIQWCASVKCDLNCQRTDDTRRIRTAIDCECGTNYCFYCGNQAHYPCDCHSAKAWLNKEVEQGANNLWLLAHSKGCPHCKSPVEKNGGCNHMKCTNCEFHFCWICMGDWNDHGP